MRATVDFNQLRRFFDKKSGKSKISQPLSQLPATPRTVTLRRHASTAYDGLTGKARVCAVSSFILKTAIEIDDSAQRAER